MLPSRFPRPARLTLFALASGVLLLLCTLPQSKLPQAGPGDKIEHAIAWFILTVTGYILAPRRRWAIPAYALAFGAFIEVLQATMGFGRHGDWRDLAVDALGVLVAVLGYHLVVRRAKAPLVDEA